MDFLHREWCNPAIRVPEFHALRLDVLPKEAIEVDREEMERALKENLHEVSGWWLGIVEGLERARSRVARSLGRLNSADSLQNETDIDHR
jgi:hypothetical protein